jgi:hypothetical protein
MLANMAMTSALIETAGAARDGVSAAGAKVSSMGADGQSDGVDSPVNDFTTPAPGERIVNGTMP